MNLRQYLAPMRSAEKAAFAVRCGTTIGHLRNVMLGYRAPSESLAIAIERESSRHVTVEELRPDVDWAFIRGTAA